MCEREWVRVSERGGGRGGGGGTERERERARERDSEREKEREKVRANSFHQAKAVRLPNTDGVMTAASRLVYDDAPWLSTSVQVAHPVMAYIYSQLYVPSCIPALYTPGV